MLGGVAKKKLIFFSNPSNYSSVFILLPLAERLSGDNSYENLTGITGLI